LGRILVGAMLLGLSILVIVAPGRMDLLGAVFIGGIMLGLPGALLIVLGWRAHYGPSKDALARRSVKELLAIYGRSPGRVTVAPDVRARVRQIGQSLDEAGGMDLMLKVHAAFAKQTPMDHAPKDLEQTWNLIGEWRGW
jgi:hypothetical protein